MKPNATEKEIKQAYFQKAKLLHPDRSKLSKDIAERRFSQLREANDTLKEYRNLMKNLKEILSLNPSAHGMQGLKFYICLLCFTASEENNNTNDANMISYQGTPNNQTLRLTYRK